MKYVVVEARTAAGLTDEVQTLMDEGWEPLGGVSVAAHAAHSWWYFQALIHRGSR